MSRLDEIYDGWKNYIFRTPEIELMAKERMSICVECEFLSIFDICEVCYCPAQKKVRSPKSHCLKNKWKDNHIQLQVEKKNTEKLKENVSVSNIISFDQEGNFISNTPKFDNYINSSLKQSIPNSSQQTTI